MGLIIFTLLLFAGVAWVLHRLGILAFPLAGFCLLWYWHWVTGAVATVVLAYIIWLAVRYYREESASRTDTSLN